MRYVWRRGAMAGREPEFQGTQDWKHEIAQKAYAAAKSRLQGVEPFAEPIWDGWEKNWVSMRGHVHCQSSLSPNHRNTSRICLQTPSFIQELIFHRLHLGHTFLYDAQGIISSSLPQWWVLPKFRWSWTVGRTVILQLDRYWIRLDINKW